MTDYTLLVEQAASMIETEPYYVAALSNISALIYESMDRLNWAGFYLMDRGSLLVGPFQGRPACIRIEIGKGVCGTAVKKKRSSGWRMSMLFRVTLPAMQHPGQKLSFPSAVTEGSWVSWTSTAPKRSAFP